MFSRFMPEHEMLDAFRDGRGMRSYNRLGAMPVDILREYVMDGVDHDPAGIEVAAYELIRASGIMICHVDLDNPVPEVLETEEFFGRESYYERVSLGFNDHGGGSESGYKILVNSPEDGQMVLFSPPDSDGNPMNMTFRRASFSFLTWEPAGHLREGYEYLDSLPNLLKTTGPAQHNRGDSNPAHYVFTSGEGCAELELMNVLRTAGFSFTTEGYGNALGRDTEYNRLAHSRESYEAEGVERRAWPLFNPYAVRYDNAEPMYQFQEQLDIVQALIEAKQSQPISP